MSEFDKAFKELNDKQAEAVEQIDGPVLVIAGPGTGKTQLLSTRVAGLLANTDTRPANILCLTFTNKAAINMKERIIKLAGQGGARVNASTFHSFAADIMNLYPDHFWNAARLSVAPESTQLDIIENIVSHLPLDNPLALKFAGQYTLLNDIQRAINLSKEAGLTPDKLRAIINVNIAYVDSIEERLVDILTPSLSYKTLDLLAQKVTAIPPQTIDAYVYPLVSLSTVINDSLAQAVEQDSGTNRTTNTGRWKSRWIQTVDGQKGLFQERQRNSWWLQLADIYEQYRDALHQRGYYDYADMLVEVLSQLEQNPEILADIQERFSYVMIDEFQDTNPAQLRLAHLVADHHEANNSPNLMAVGDDDQSIFKFNGAELNNMLGFRRAYPDAKIIILTDNYRSTQAVLDCAAKVINQATTRLVDIDPSLSKKLVAADPPPAGRIEALSYSSRELQFSEIARDIKAKHRPGQEIAVLARSHDSLIKMTGLLQQLQVPVRYEQQTNILDYVIVDQVYLTAKLTLAIQAGDQDTANALIHQIIRWPAWDIAPKTLWQVAAANYSSQQWLDSLLGSADTRLRAIGNWFVWLAQQTDSQPLAVTLEQILGLRPGGDFTSPIQSYYLQKSVGINDYFHGLSAIQLLRSLVHDFSASAEPTLEELVRFIEINRENAKIVADESPFITGAHSVQLLTVHKAKGLEFDHVYIIDAVDDNWQPRHGSRRPPANLPLQPVGDDYDDYVRLMYVALTRAKSSITLSAYHQDHNGKEVALSSIIQSVLTFKPVDKSERQELITVLEENLRWPNLSGGEEKEIIKARLETYNLSVTHLLNFLDLTKGGPEYFKERNLLNLPEVKSSSLSYGTAIHAAMDSAQKLTNRGEFSLARTIKDFGEALKAEQMPPDQLKRYAAQGKRELTRLFKDIGYKLPQGSPSEQKFRDVMVGKARLGGKLDRVDNDGHAISIIDYKTGRPLSGFDTKNQSLMLKAYKHRTQLIFYTLLIGPQSLPVEGQMVYVEASSAKDLCRAYQPTPDDINHLSRLVDAIWPLITEMRLPDVSHYPQNFEGIQAFEQDLLK